MDGGAIAGIVVGVLFAIAAAGAALGVWWCRRRKARDLPAKLVSTQVQILHQESASVVPPPPPMEELEKPPPPPMEPPPIVEADDDIQLINKELTPESRI